MESIQRRSFRLISFRAAVLIALILIPVLTYVVAGTYALWKTNLLIWLWWLVPVFWALTWIVAKLWRSKNSADDSAIGAAHWTPRDERAAEVVKQYQQQVDHFSPKELTDLHFYLSQVQLLANDVARVYHPGAGDPLSSLTIMEIAAAIRLVADDLEHLALHSLPGSRLLTVQQWKSLQHAPKWVKRIRNTAWAAAMFINPLNIARFGAAKATIEPVGGGVRTELLATFYLRLIRQVGFYLIEMNSGRLRGGANAYRAAFDLENARLASHATGTQTDRGSANNLDEQTVTIGLVGQVSSGKSSLINCLVGQTTAAVDLLPETKQVQRYELNVEQSHGDINDNSLNNQVSKSTQSTVTLLDTPGYGDAGASAAQVKQIEQALVESDIVLLVLDAHSPARSADQATISTIQKWYDENPQLKPPPVLAVLTHVDLLPPALNWEPPYDLDSPTSSKGKSISEAIDYTREVFGNQVYDVVAVCTDSDPQRTWGIAELLMPAIATQLKTAQSIAVLHAFERGLANESPLKTLLKQAGNSGKQILKSWLQVKLNQLEKK